MKAERAEKKFNPVVLTLTSEDEVKLLKGLIANTCSSDAQALSQNPDFSIFSFYSELDKVSKDIDYVRADFTICFNN